METTAIRFGQAHHLLGFYRRAQDGSLSDPVVLAWNTGLWNRSGPLRLNTELALELAHHGLASFCFDVSAHGDAANRSDLFGPELVQADIRDAIREVRERFGHQQIILFGVCSSAIEAQGIAVENPAVVGLIMIDTYAYRTQSFYVHYYKQRVFSLKRWKNKFKKHDKQDKESDAKPLSDLFEGVYPERDQAARELRTLVDRGVHLWVAFTGGFRHIYSYPHQFIDTFSDLAFGSALTLEYYRWSDHLFAIREQRQLLFADLKRWLERCGWLKKPIDRTLSTLIQSWEQRVAPEAIAVHFDQETWTYSHLRQRVDTILRALQATGVKAGDRVGLALPRHPDLIAAVVAIIKMGACYIPIDLSYPAERIATILTISEPEIILCLEQQRAQFEAYPTLFLDTVSTDTCLPPEAVVLRDKHDLAYIIFTSGSTGTPKGVMMGHGALAQLIVWQNSSYRPASRTLQFSPISFDVSFQEIFSTLALGQSLVLVRDEERLDPRLLLKKLMDQKIERLFLPYVALQLLAEAAVRTELYPQSLKDVFTAGEQLICTKEIRQFFQNVPEARLHNQYGPSETHVATALSLHADPSTWPDLPSIGRAIPGTTCFILDPHGRPSAIGEEGELYLAGLSVGEGYWNNPVPTAQRFITLEQSGSLWRAYRTGDLARWDQDGTIHFLGRADDQVKIRGFRVEIGEIESHLQRLPQVTQAVVLVMGERVKELVAVLQGTYDPQALLEIKKTLSECLPEYMRPQRYVTTAKIPLTPSGKIDRRSLAASLDKNQVQRSMDAATSDNMKRIAEAFAQILNRQDLPPDAHFFDHGGSSILAIKLAYLLEETIGKPVSVISIFEHPTLPALTRALFGEARAEPPLASPTPERGGTHDIAIIGMAARFPGAPDLAAFWQMLRGRHEGITHFRPEELDPQIDPEERNSPQYVARRGIIDDATAFDAEFFHVSKTEAELLDPQQRVFLELSYQALEDAGYAGRSGSSIGVFAGAAHNTYYIHKVLKNPSILRRSGSFAAMLANDKDYLATRVAYKLDLRGPAIDVQTACSSSAVALCQAISALRSGQCEMALAGGVAISVPIRSGYLANEGAMLSPSGRCRPFSKEADGTIFSDGAGVVLLKALSAAQRDGDRIYAVIRGMGINNDGSGKASFTAPSVQGQREAVAAAWRDAQLSPKTAHFIECHGTATALGDPIEVEALQGVFQEATPQSIGLGSVKGNIGHTTAAAGVAGVIKTALSLYHRQVVGSLTSGQVNPLLTLEKSPFHLLREGRSLPAGSGPMHAGVSSFGVGGTNVHLVLTAGDQAVASLSPVRPGELLLASARQPASLSRLCDRLDDWQGQIQPQERRALAAELLRRPTYSHRAYLVRSAPSATASDPWKQAEIGPVPALIWSFPGQGTQASGMGQGLADFQPLFRSHRERLLAQVRAQAGWDLETILTATSDLSQLHETRYAQPAIFVTSLSLAYTLRDLGLKPDALIGHSIGELAAATYAGLWSEDDALSLTIKRGELMSELPRGGMLAVVASSAEIQPILHQDCDLAAINGIRSVVIAGPLEALAQQTSILEGRGIKFKRLETSHAFHSRAMNPMFDTFRTFIATLPTYPTHIPIYSTRLGRLAQPEELASADYWAEHIRQPVQFHAAATALAQNFPLKAVLEVGSGRVTASLLTKLWGDRARFVRSVLGSPREEWLRYIEAIGDLWLHGFEMECSEALDLKSQKVSWAPPYAFKKDYFSIESAEEKMALSPVSPAERINIMQDHLRRERMSNEVVRILEECSGLEGLSEQRARSFFDLGLDSLFLTQASLALGQFFGLTMSFRQLSEDLISIDRITEYLTQKLPPDRFASEIPKHEMAAPMSGAQGPAAQGPEAPTLSSAMMNATSLPHLPAGLPTMPPAPLTDSTVHPMLQLLQQQMELMRLVLLQGQTPNAMPQAAAAMPAQGVPTRAPEAGQTSLAPPMPLSKQSEAEPPKQAFGAIARISHDKVSMTEQQRKTLQDFVQRYTAKTMRSKSYTTQFRSVMADPRVVTGFRPNLKELIYPIVTERSDGPYLWDLDGHRYIDMLNGFGSNFFGHAPAFMKEVLHRQVDAGYEIGPQFHLVGEASQLAAELTGHDRVAWCNTGSEAVLGCLRIARTVTGRSKVVSFLGSYHGINDEVIVRSNAQRKPFPAAPGILGNAVENMLVLEYGTEESLAIIEKELPNLAAVLVEPVQSRRPEWVPVDFWHRLRELTSRSGVALIFDEVITGFRYHPGGIQGAFGIQADLASYGKVVGGGLPIGLIAGKRAWMDALDGGSWSFGDDSVPEVGVTYFAGTFVRHPLAIAAAHATLREIKQHGGELQKATNLLTDRLVSELNGLFKELDVPYTYCSFGSLMKLKTKDDKNPFVELLSAWLRDKGLHIWDNFPNFMTASHKEEHRLAIVQAFRAALEEMIAGGLFPDARPSKSRDEDAARRLVHNPPVPGARLGKGADGRPAWFVEDPKRPGRYLQLTTQH